MNDRENLERKIKELFSYIKFQVDKVNRKEETKEGAFNGIANKFERVEIIRKNVGTAPVRETPPKPKNTESIFHSIQRTIMLQPILRENTPFKPKNKSLEEFGKDDIQ